MHIKELRDKRTLCAAAVAQAPTPTRCQTVSDSFTVAVAVADSDADSNSKNQAEPNRIVIINNANNYIDFIQGRCRLSARFVQRFSSACGFALIAAAAGVGKNQQTSHLPLELRILTNLMAYYFFFYSKMFSSFIFFVSFFWLICLRAAFAWQLLAV